MKTFNAADFQTRAELESKIGSVLGLTSELKVDVQISGTREQLAKLQLSDRTIFWGIKCIITDEPTVDPPQTEKPNRGEIQDSGINGQKKKAITK